MSNTFKVPFIDLPAEYRKLEAELTHRFKDICQRGQFILREEVNELEDTCADYLNVNHAIGVGSGSDALLLALLALGIGKGDEVITVSHTFVATLSAISFTGATPVVIDIGDDHNLNHKLLEAAITPDTRAVIVVHMNGYPCEMNAIRAVCKQNNIYVVEDAAQAFGTKYFDEYVGGMGDFACFSFHPMKVFHGLGDGGLVTTNDAGLAEKIRLLRNHGQTREKILCYGFNSRLDNLQAGFLLEYLKKLEIWILRRQEIGQKYTMAFQNIQEISLPKRINGHIDVYSSYVMETVDRDSLRKWLLDSGIEVFSHWDPPLHEQDGLKMIKHPLNRTKRLSSSVLSLPIHPHLSASQIDYVIERVTNFYEH